MRHILGTVGNFAGWAFLFAGLFAAYHKDPNAISWIILSKLMWIHDDILIAKKEKIK